MSNCLEPGTNRMLQDCMERKRPLRVTLDIKRYLLQLQYKAHYC